MIQLFNYAGGRPGHPCEVESWTDIGVQTSPAIGSGTPGNAAAINTELTNANHRGWIEMASSSSLVWMHAQGESYATPADGRSLFEEFGDDGDAACLTSKAGFNLDILGAVVCEQYSDSRCLRRC